jgi:rhamnose transport system permease protein
LTLTRERAALAAWLILLGLLALLAPSFFELGNLRDVVLGVVPVLIVAIGMTFVIVAGQIDISVGSQFAVCSVAAGLLAVAGLPMVFVALATCLLGAVFGCINGALVSWLGVPSIVATLAMMVGMREGLRLGTGGAWVQNLPPTFQWFGWGQATGQFIILFSAAVLFVVTAWAARNVAGARSVYATGSDVEAARLSGIDTGLVTAAVFVGMGALTGLAAVLNAIRFSDVQSNAGVGLELKAIAAVVVGGAAITGGRGSFTGTLIGVALLGSIGPALTFVGISPFWEKAIQGGIILTAVMSEAVAARRSKLHRSHA